MSDNGDLRFGSTLFPVIRIFTYFLLPYNLGTLPFQRCPKPSADDALCQEDAEESRT